MGQRQCPYCGKSVADHHVMCPFCRESLPDIHVSRTEYGRAAGGGPEMRRGLLFMFLAAVFYYFAGGYSPLELPLRVANALTDYLLPLLFLGGLGMLILGIFRRHAG